MKPLTGLPVESFVEVSREADIPLKDLLQVVQQVENGASAAFLARYRADLCGGLDESRLLEALEKLRARQDLIDHRLSMLTTLGQQGALTDALRKELERAPDRRTLNDIFRPYRARQPEPADAAISQGLDPLARTLWFQEEGLDLEAEATKHVKPEAGVADSAQALDGASSIAARWLSEKPEILHELRQVYRRNGELAVKARPAARKNPRTAALDGYKAKVAEVPWQKRLAIRRGVQTGQLEAATELPHELAVATLERRLIKNPESVYAPHLKRTVNAALHNGLAGRIRKDVLRELDEQTDGEAIQTFQKALRNALLAPPAVGLRIVGIETGRPGGWRAALIGPQGELLDSAIVRDGDSPAAPAQRGDLPPSAGPQMAAGAAAEPSAPAPPTQAEAAEPPASPANAPVPPGPAEAGTEEATAAGTQGPENPSAPGAAPQKTDVSSPDAAGASPPAPAEASAPKAGSRRTRKQELSEFLRQHEVDLIVVPAGPRPHETEKHLRGQIRRSGRTDVGWLAVRDAGTWIYATSKLAKRELPGVEGAVRSAASLARRVQDPLAELAKADPRTLGIGLHYQEVEPERLRAALRQTLECVVHDVGVDLNRAPAPLLALVPGFTERLAKRVIEHRDKRGPFETRQDLQKVQSLSDRVFAQAAGFLRVHGPDPLDATGIHPDCRDLAESFAESAGCDLATLLAEPERLDAIDPEQFATPERPARLIEAAMRELKPERRSVRGAFQKPRPAVPLRSDDEFRPGRKVAGVVANVADFGVFVDIGADQDALLHISQIRREHLQDSRPSFQAGDTVELFVRAADPDGRRIGLSMWEPRAAPRRPPGPGRQAHGGERGRGRRGPDRTTGGRPLRRTFGPDPRERRDGRREGKMSLQDKLNALQDKYRTKV